MLHECYKWMTMKSFDLLPRLSISISSSQIRPPIDQSLCWQNPLPTREIESTYFSFFEQTKLFFSEFTRQTLDEYCLRISVWPDLAKFHHFGNRLKVYLVLGKVFSSLWHNLYAIGQIFIAENGQILKTQFVIWSHCLASTTRIPDLVWRFMTIVVVKWSPCFTFSKLI